MKKAYLISCSDHYSDRFEALAEGLRELGLESVYITSDFDHRHKIRYHSPVPGCVRFLCLHTVGIFRFQANFTCAFAQKASLS